ncbi:tetratricopeptide repeat protein [Croceivirga thetidis]|uniref:Tetratricopeptide repeat protein n=1 Tax=Croceivirga thetidis TaxID=2721623 RepID=A0ABX1GQC0_9FLAO|nr:hypothetical protein [Croceivirga thetidis]NKI31155.1 hypothetical protein [Croceivirga thetidis]
MKKYLDCFFLLTILGLTSQTLICQEQPSKILQEEESAEVFLEEYTDEFQEKFFEALKQKGIENYDRAINLLLECKSLEPFNTAIDHELAKTYFLNKQYIPSQEYAENALTKNPENFWFLETWYNSVLKQSNSVEVLKGTIPYDNEMLRQNLSLIYFKNKDYTAAKKELKSLRKSDFSAKLTRKIDDSLQKRKEVVVQNNMSPKSKEVTTNPTEELKQQLEDYIQKGQFKNLAEEAEEAIENYPLQPYFYYAYGLALNKQNEPNKATEVLLSALDYLFDDDGLTSKIYKELANAYGALGNSSKANEYLSKVKSGS